MITNPSIEARSGRLGGKPYDRDESKLKRSSSMLSLPGRGIKGIMSILGLSRSHSSRGLPLTNDDIATDQKSESGSEDNFSGSPPAAMRGQDVYTLAKAAGVEGAGFESRAAAFRAAKGEKPGGRREMARRSLQTIEAPMPFQPSSAQANNIPRPAIAYQPAAAPLQAADPAPTSVAIKAIIDAKHGQDLTTEDMRVISTLTQNALQSDAATMPRRTPTPEPREHNSWAAGNYTPRTIRPLPPSAPSDIVFGFSLGASPAPSARRLTVSTTYHAPGYGTRNAKSPRSKRTGLKPLFTAANNDDSESASPSKGRFMSANEGPFKKRRPSDSDAETSVGDRQYNHYRDDESDMSPVFRNRVPRSYTMGDDLEVLAREAASLEAALASSRARASSPARVPPADAVSRGKKRAADMISELVKSELDIYMDNKPFVVNPYHPDARTVVASFKSERTAASAAPGTPGQSINKASSTSKTPLRGAAKRLDEAKPPVAKKRRGSYSCIFDDDDGDGVDAPVTGDSDSERTTVEPVDAITAGKEASAADTSDKQTPAPPRPAKRKIDEPAPVQPFPAPQLSDSNSPKPNNSGAAYAFSFTPPTAAFQFGSSDQNSPAPSSSLFDFTTPAAPAQSMPFQFGSGSQSASFGSGSSLFGSSNQAPQMPQSVQQSAGPQPMTSLFGGNLFGAASNEQHLNSHTTGSNLFGSKTPASFNFGTNAPTQPASGLFGQAAPSVGFGSATAPASSPFTSAIDGQLMFSIGAAPAKQPFAASRTLRRTSRQNIFHSPRTSARSLADEVVPFYTFSGGIEMITTPGSKQARLDALGRPIPKFQYVVTPPDDFQSNVIYGRPCHNRPFWFCDGCRQLNGSAIHKCVNCRAPMPKTVGYLTPSMAKKVWPDIAAKLGYIVRGREAWFCGECKYRNSASSDDRHQCTACKASRKDYPVSTSTEAGERSEASKAGRTTSKGKAKAQVNKPYERQSSATRKSPSRRPSTKLTPSTKPLFAAAGTDTKSASTVTTASAAAPSQQITTPFNWAAAAKPNNTWTCDTCFLANPDSATDKCTICEADRPKKAALSTPAPAPVPAPAPIPTAVPANSNTNTTPGGFNWAAAGGKQATTGRSAATWTCGTCMLQNPATAVDKCTICEAPRMG